jgi:hypothetical protein
MLDNAHPAYESGHAFGTNQDEPEFPALNVREAQCSLRKLGLGSEYGSPVQVEHCASLGFGAYRLFEKL